MNRAPPAPVVPLRPPTGLADRDDDALMALSAAGHRAAFEMLAGRHVARVVSYCAKFLGDARQGEEVAQDVLLELWQQRARYVGRGRLEVYLYTIARNRCRNGARDERRRRAATWPAGTGLAEGRDGGDQLERVLEHERARRVREALLALPEKLREAVLLRFDQGLDYAEIGMILRRPEATVRSRVFHALRRLRDQIGEYAP